MINITYRYNKITYKIHFSEKSHYLLATYIILHSVTLQPLCVNLSTSKQTPNIFVPVQFAGLRNSCDNIVKNVNMVALQIVHLSLDFMSKTEKD
jgi:hypothetical protein